MPDPKHDNKPVPGQKPEKNEDAIEEKSQAEGARVPGEKRQKVAGTPDQAEGERDDAEE